MTQSQGTMDTRDIFMSDGRESVGMEEWYYPKIFTRPSRYACVIQAGGLVATVWAHAYCIFII